MNKKLFPPDYPSFLAGLKERILQARISASRAVSRDLVLLYRDIVGVELAQPGKQRNADRGDAIVERFSADLQAEFPNMRGFSLANIWRMRQLFSECSSPGFFEQFVRVLKKGGGKLLERLVPEIVQSLMGGHNAQFLAQAARELVASIPWGHRWNGGVELAQP